MDSFALLASESLAASKTFFATITSLSELNFDSFCWYKQKSDFYKLWQQHKQLKNMETDEAWPDIYDEEHIHQIQFETTHKIL